MDGSLRVAYLAIKKYTTEVVHITSVIVLMLFTLTAAMLDCTVQIGGAFQAGNPTSRSAPAENLHSDLRFPTSHLKLNICQRPY